MTPTEIEEVKRLLVLNYIAAKKTQPEIHALKDTQGCFAVAISRFTGKVNAIHLPSLNFNQVEALNNSDNLIQNVIPQCNPDEREFFQTSATVEEWDKMFG